ncbi:MAG: hypothetical protein M1335_02665 [Chloroflexi bacterium]|nr:hypothetical protein [Chloroflexota bacterium]
MNKRTVLMIAGVFVVLLLIPSVVMSTNEGLQGLRVTLDRAFYVVTFAKDNPMRLQAMHQNNEPGEAGSRGCIACHGNMVEKKYPVHYVMLTLKYMSFSCTDCHKSVDIRTRRPGAATIQVDRKLCASCHNPPVLSQNTQEGQSEIGRKYAPAMPSLLVQHGEDPKNSLKWVSDHPAVAMAMGIAKCRECHLKGSELDFCNVCHLRGGFFPKSHQPEYKMPVNQIYPRTAKRTDTVSTHWKGYHFVLVRDALEKMGAKNVSASNLPKDKLEKLPCGACHDIDTWCTKCHIKHAPDWLNPVTGHPAYVAKYGQKYCFQCHDSSKCLSCHTYVGQLGDDTGK